MSSSDAGFAAERRRGRPRLSAYIPPQHGAWAFLLVPLLVGFAVAGWHPAGLLFAVSWVVAYPLSYFGGRAVTARARRGAWSRLARREAARALPWLICLAVLAPPLLFLAPWLLAVAAIMALSWLGSLALAARYGERSLTNDLVLVGQAVCGAPLVWAVVAAAGGVAGIPRGTPIWDSLPAAPTSLITGTVAAGLILVGSVLAVKSVLREAGNIRFRVLSIGYHLTVALIAWWADPVWLVAFGTALGRALLLRPGMRPGIIGAGEIVVTALFVGVAFTVL